MKLFPTGTDKAQADRDDLNNEMAGRPGGKRARFFTEAEIQAMRDPEEDDEKKAEEKRRYEELMEQTRAMMRDLNEAVERAMEKAEERVRLAERALQEIKARASVDDSGRRVYLTANRQQAYTEEGVALSKEEIAKVQWKTDVPTWEQFQESSKRLNEAIRSREEIEAYKQRLDYYQARGQQGDLTPDELQTIRQDLSAMPQSVQAEMKPTGPSIANGGQKFTFPSP